jgi:hypothetical protein
MSDLWEAVTASDLAYRLGWVLVHSLWLGAAVAALLATAEFALRRRSAQSRYLAGCAAMLAMAGLSTTAFFFAPTRARPMLGGTYGTAATDKARAAGAAAESGAFSGDLGDAAANVRSTVSTDRPEQPRALPLHRASGVLERAVPWLALSWAVGVVALAVWQSLGWVLACRIRRRAVRPEGDSIVETAARLARAMHIRVRVKVMESAGITVPTLIGWLTPTILLPIGLAAGMTAGQVEALLAHELAHVRRHDYLINLVQVLVETLFFFHPAVWYVSRRVRVERENCCDDLVVAHGTEPAAYVEALMCVARRAVASRGAGYAAALAGSVAVTALGKPSELRRRIRRILGGGTDPAVREAGRWPAGVLAVGAMACAATLLHVPPPKAVLAAPAVQQQRRVGGSTAVHPTMLQSKVWVELQDRLAKSDAGYAYVEVDAQGACRLSLAATATSDVSHLKGMPLESLNLSNTVIKDLSPLEGMPLRVLDLSGTQVKDLSPLRGMKLRSLRISNTRVKDLSPLNAAALTELDASGAPLTDLSPLAGMPLAYLDVRKTTVMDLSPLADTPLSTLELDGNRVKDLSPLRTTRLAALTLEEVDGLDLAQLAGIPVKSLTLSGRRLTNLLPLRTTTLESLRIVDSNVNDLTPLTGVPLRQLDLGGSPVSDLSPLRGMKLTELFLSSPGPDLAPLAGMPLVSIGLPEVSTVVNLDILRDVKTLKQIRPSGGKLLPAAEFWNRYDAGEFGIRPAAAKPSPRRTAVAERTTGRRTVRSVLLALRAGHAGQT